MPFILNPSNKVITLAEINSMTQFFYRLIKTRSATFPRFTYEKVKVSSVLPLLNSLTPTTSSYIKGMKIIPTLRALDEMRFIYCPTVAEFHDEFSGFTVFSYNTEDAPFDMISSNPVYWVVNEELVELAVTDIQTAIDDFQRYVDEILISHDGTGDPSSYESYVVNQDTSSTYVTLDQLQQLVSDNKDSGNNDPEYLYFQNTAAEIDGVYRHTSAESIFIPGTTSGNNPGNGTFANKAADFHGVCPPMCKKIVAIKDILIHQ
jgi:hypothetical protein